MMTSSCSGATQRWMQSGENKIQLLCISGLGSQSEKGEMLSPGGGLGAALSIYVMYTSHVMVGWIGKYMYMDTSFIRWLDSAFII